MKFPLLIRVSGQQDLDLHTQEINTLLGRISLFAIPTDSGVRLNASEGVTILGYSGIGLSATLRYESFRRGYRLIVGSETFNLCYLYSPSSGDIERLIGKLGPNAEFQGAYLDRTNYFVSCRIARALVNLSLRLSEVAAE